MKRLLITICIVMTFTAIHSQEKSNLIKLDIGLFNKVRLGYEHPLNEKFSIGGVVNAYYGMFPGIKIEPFARYYFGSECPSGLYAQARFLYGNFHYYYYYYTSNYDPFNIKQNKEVVNTMGGGLDLGYQWLSGKNKNIIVDISLGIQDMPIISKSNSISTIDAIFYVTGPGAIFNPHLSIGYAF